MPAIRLEGTEEIAGNWVDLADAWTRAEARDWYSGSLAANDTLWLPLLGRKLVAVHVRLADGTLIETPAALIERFDDLDMRVTRWLARGIMDALKELFKLGEQQKRLLFDGVEVAATTRKTTP